MSSQKKKRERDARDAKKVVQRTLAHERRRRVIVVTCVAAAVIVLAALIGFGVYESQKKPSFAKPANTTESSSGVIAGGTGPVKVDMYVDYQCPICKQFEASAEAQLDQWVADNKITLVYHPVAFLDRMSTTNYSTRASAASGCASDQDKFLAYTKVLYANQPAEGSAGLTDDQLINLGGKAGITDPAFAACVRAGTYKTWVSHVTDAAAANNVTGTPTVLVNGKDISQPGFAPTLKQLQAAVDAA